MKIRAIDSQEQQILQAAADGDLEYVQSLSQEAVSKARCVSGCSSLHWACGSNQVATVQYLLEFMEVDIQVINGKKAANRTPLHYAARNGCLEVIRLLVEEHGANVHAEAKHKVTPFHLALFQNRLETAKYFVENLKVDYLTPNDFGCSAVHWLSICPRSENLVASAKWLSTLKGIDWAVKQKQGHSALHKASWMGHTELVSYLHEVHNMWDDQPDESGNYAADLAEMGRNFDTAAFLRRECSRDRARSCKTLKISTQEASDPQKVRQAYLRLAKQKHPDRSANVNTTTEFDAIQKAYHHLTVEDGMGKQRNPAHSLNLLLQAMPSSPNKTSHVAKHDDNCFQARILAVLHEYGDKGLDLSNLKKKWKQVWGDNVPFPSHKGKSLARYIKHKASDTVELRNAEGTCRAHIKQSTKERFSQALENASS